MKMSLTLNQLALALLGIVIISSNFVVSAYPALPHGHVHKRQSYARSNQLPPPGQDHYYGQQSSYKNYNYNYEPRAHYNNNNNNGYYQPQPSSNYYYDNPPSQQQYYGGRDPLQGAYASVNPIQREITVRNGQLRQKEYQQRTGQEGRDTYDPFYFYVNPIAASAAAAAAAAAARDPQNALIASPSPSASSGSLSGSLPPSPTTITASLTASANSRDHVGGPPRNRRNSLNAPPRDSYFDNEISGDKYEILTSKPSFARLQNGYPPSPAYPSSRYSSAAPHHHQPSGNPNQFLNYEQIVGAQPPRYANGSPPPPNRGQPWTIQIGTQLKVNDDGKGPNSGSRYYVRDERNTRSRQPHYRK